MAWYDSWQGFFFGSSNATADRFPMKYIDEKSWSSNPNFREEIKAYRDENTRKLTRVTAPGKKSSFKFDTRDGLHLDDKKKIQKFFTDRETGDSETTPEQARSQRKIHLWYWNDEDNNYKEGDFYRPNMEFKIKRVTTADIIYDKMTIELIEY